MYREQEFVDRCHCHAPATARCAMCNRPRCAQHLERDGRCHRCEEAMGYEMEGRAPARLASTGVLGVASFLGLMIAHAALALVVPVPAAVAGATYVAHRGLQRRRAERVLGPRLAASVGEVAPVVDYDEPRFPEPTRGVRTFGR